ncbi:uncharacterized protein LOC126747785 [Anthonomus grandis grandis]|uniref:uncharacterized protein LOC126747785 n=1 Tax=Anthonomus grandis grandis TaxID=2921223 RepID=UPI002165D1FF|nr:uncharacterized protein LOC126747785 [Anthonomus grandis grandis]
MMYTYLLNLLDSESDSDFVDEEIAYTTIFRRKLPKSDYLKKRKTHGEFVLQKELSEEKYKNYYRVTRAQFAEIHGFIKEDIEAEGCNASKPIGTEEKLAVFLRYIASGNCFKSMGYSYRMSDRTVSNIVNEVAGAIWKRMQPLCMPQGTAEHWTSIAHGFEERWQFPHCIGAIDGKHALIKKPSLSGSSFFNYKKIFSIVLMAIVDYKFITIDVGSMGRFSDGNIFGSSVLAKKLKNNTLNIPPASLIPIIDDPMPYVFVGDEAFPLCENLMRPYPKRSVMDNYENKVLNYRLSRARQTVECSFGILASRFRVFRSPFECKLDSVVKV